MTHYAAPETVARAPLAPRPALLSVTRSAILVALFASAAAQAQTMVSVTATDETAGESPPDSGQFRVSSDTAPSQSVTVRYAISGSATPGDDYAALPGEVTLTPGQPEAFIVVDVPGDDGVFEGDESVTVTLLEEDGDDDDDNDDDDNDDGIVVVSGPATVDILDSSHTVTIAAVSDASEDPIDAGEFSVSLGARNESGSPLSVSYSVGGTATEGTDYAPLSGTASIPVGAESASIEITPLNDDTPEDTETVAVTLTGTSDSRAPPGEPDTASVSITDGDEEPDVEVVLSVTADDDTASESPADPAEFLVQRVGGSDRAVTVDYSLGGSATEGEDFAGLSGSITLDEGENAAAIRIDVPGDDDVLEGDETVILTLLEAEDVSIDSASASITITDSSYSVTVSRISNAGENPLGIGRMRVSLGAINGSGEDLRVEYDVGGTASPGTDYEALSGVAVIDTGARTVDIDVTPLDDDIDESDETVEIMLTGTSNPDVSIGDPSQAQLVIAEDDQDDDEVTVSISAPDDTASEGSDGTARFEVNRVGGADRAVTVNYSIGGSASPGLDYAALSGTVSLGQNESRTSILVEVTGDDDLFEGDETVTIRLLGSDGEVSVATDTATVTITDSSHAVSIATASNASENPAREGEMTVSLGARNESGSALSVNYSVSGSARPGTDYEALNGVAVIPTGSGSVSIIVRPLDDDLLEQEETVDVTLTGTSDSRAPVGQPASASVSIADDDSGDDADGDGVSNTEECPDPDNCPDTDENGVPDFQDPDDDGDGIPTARENAPDQDTDEDGTPDYLDADDDGDGRPTADEDANSDGDGDPSTNPTDLDGDQVPDYLDADNSGGPAGDVDGDGLSNDRESEIGTDPESADTDNDGVGDGDEVSAGTDPLDRTSFADADGDLVPDAVEAADGTDPSDPDSYADSDGGGTADHVETISYATAGIPSTNVANAADDRRDLDGDGLPDRLEIAVASDPEDPASPTSNGAGDDDRDGVTNAVEAHLAVLGIVSVDAATDFDRDGYADVMEVALGLDPLSATERDGDRDGVPDVVEALAGMDIDAETDSDGDGVPDAREFALGSDFLDANLPVGNGAMDDDGDGISNAIEHVLEVLNVSDDVAADTDSDGDGIPDAAEIRLGADPARDEQPVPWIELRQEGIGSVKAVLPEEGPAAATALISGHQAGTLLYDWTESDNAVLAVSISEQTSKTLAFSPRTLPSGTYRLVVQVERALDDYRSGVSRVEYPLVVLPDGQPADVRDTDSDGIPDTADDMNARTGFPYELPAQSGSWLQATPGLRLQLGDTARESGATSARVSGQAVDANGDTYEYPGGIYDFEITALPEVGSVAQIVIPQASPIGEFPEYRKHQQDSGWFEFVEDANNAVASAAGSSQGCPPPGDDSYQPGLAAGHFCVRLAIEDGGPNDADADLGPNGIIKDPGGVAVPEGEVVAGSGSGRTGALTVCLLAILAIVAAARKRRRRADHIMQRPAVAKLGERWL